MSDKKKPYTNLDLETADNLLVASGHEDQARALRHYTQGIRNFLQGEFGQSFINAYESISEKHTIRILTENALRLDQLTGLVQQDIVIGRKALTAAERGETQLVALKKVVVVLEKGQKASKKQWVEVLDLLADSKSDRADLRSRITALAEVVEEHNRITAGQAALAKDVADLKEWRAKMERDAK